LLLDLHEPAAVRPYREEHFMAREMAMLSKETAITAVGLRRDRRPIDSG
jgi:hypothetical protein